MKKNYILLIAALCATTTVISCSKTELEQESIKEDSSDYVTYTISAILPEEVDSKVTITEEADYSAALLAWSENDQLMLVRDNDANQISYPFGIDNNSIDGKRAEFSYTGPAIGDGPYTIFYHTSKPLNLDKFNSITTDGQVQSSNGSTTHLNYGVKLSGVDSYESISFTDEWASAHNGSLVQNSVMQMLLKLPADVTEVYSIYAHDAGTFKQTLWFNDGNNVYGIPNSQHVIKGYMMVPDMDLTSPLTIRVETEDGAYEASYPLDVTDWTGGSQYTLKKNMSGLSAVTGDHAAMEIHAKCAQDIIQFKNGVGATKDRFKASSVILERDIDMQGVTWDSAISGFTGTFGSPSSADKKTISKVLATAPIFDAIPTGATVKDFELGGSFTLTQASSGNDYLGALAKSLQGTLSGVTVNANVSLVANSRSSLLDMGGIIGRANNVAASITDCCFKGSIVVPSGYSNSNANGLRLGGIVGYVTKAITISNSSFEGTIKCEGGFTTAATDPLDASKHPALCLGGIVGKLQLGTISGCTTVDAAEASKLSATIDNTAYKGSILIKSSNCNSAAIGGIAGFCYDDSASINGCTNASTILTNITPTDAENVYLFCGGIIGLNRMNLTGCTNNGAQQHFSSSRIQSIGGIVGRQQSGTIDVSTGISNTGDISFNNSPTISDYQYSIGGVIGHSTVAVSSTSATISNSGTINVTNGGVKCTTPTDDNFGVFQGGIVGYTTAAIKKASNTGNLTYVCKNQGSSEVEGGSQYVYLGGIVGKVKGASYSARVDIEYCSNSGVLTHNPTSTAPNSATCFYQYNYLGGIAGYAEFVNIKGDSSNKTTNSGNITGGCSTPKEPTAHDYTFYVGGIVGYLNGRNSTISYCDLTGSATVTNQHFSNRSVNNHPPMCGGIAGCAYGTYENHVSISYCSVASTAKVAGTRGFVGGIVGFARGANVSDCTMPVAFQSSAYVVGGIVGTSDGSNVTACTFSADKVRSSNMQYGGGIVGRLRNGTNLIDGCYSHATDVSKNDAAADNGAGAIAGASTTTSTIKNCHYKSGMSICGDSNFTAGTGDEANAADL